MSDGGKAVAGRGDAAGERSIGPAAARKLEDDVRLLVDSVQDYAIFMLDPAGHVVTWNVAAARMKGYSRDQILGRHFSLFHPAEEQAAGQPDIFLEEAKANGRAEREGWRVRSDGTRFWANVVLTAVVDSSGDLRGFAKVTRDLTERRRAEDARVHLMQAREAIRVRDEFLSIASHELRTPLNSLNLLFEAAAIALERGEPTTPEILGKARKQVRRLFELVNRMLDATRASRGVLQIKVRRRVDLLAIIRDVMEELREEARQGGIAIAVSGPARLEVDVDPLLVHEVFSNVVGNALKYGGGRPVDLRVRRPRPNVAVVTVRDRGIGIAPEHVKRIFEPFQRVADRAFGGLGLGLYVARNIVEAHGGTIHVTSMPGEGSSFHVMLPASPEQTTS